MIDFDFETRFPKYQFSDKEYSESDLSRAITILKHLGAQCEDERWGLAGSQEISQYTFTLNENVIVIQAETYMGLVIFTNTEILQQFKRRWQNRREKRTHKAE